MTRESCHEAGHALVALCLEFQVERIEVLHGLPTTVCNLDSPQRTSEERYLVLAGGAASEVLSFGNYCRETSKRDQEMIAERGGGDIEYYLPEAQRIIGSNESCFIRFADHLALAWLVAAAEATFTSDPDSYVVLSQTEIERIWYPTENKL